MTALLCTLGNSWAVVPEAYLMGNGSARYDSVWVIATSGIDGSVTRCREWFIKHTPSTKLSIFVIDDLPDIRNGEDHQRYEEALFRVYSSAWQCHGAENLHVCLAGGFKTISSSAHQTADLFGCEKLFHITTPSSTKDHPTNTQIFATIEEELNKAKIHPYLTIVDLGPRPGWPTIQELLAEAPSLPACDALLTVSDTKFREKILNRIGDANRLSASEHELATLPFAHIARWPPSARAWLTKPLNPDTDSAWVLSLPKVELHCHLGGFATHGEALRLVREASSNPDLLPELQERATPPGWPSTTLENPPAERLQAYMRLGDNNGSALLKDPACLEKHCRLLYEHLVSQNVIYAEIRCSPANYTTTNRSPWDVLSEIKSTFDRCMGDALNCQINLIIIATRKENGDYRTAIGRHLALAATAAEHWRDPNRCRVVGVDLAGYEDLTTRAHHYRDDFRAIHRLGLALTVHAGENDDAEGIWSAIFDLNARRIGHALSLKESEDLMRSVADRRIAVEMCPYANLQIKGYPLDDPIREHKHPYPLLTYLRAGVPVTVNTDNIGISAASLTENFLLLARLCPGITRLDILHLLRNSIDATFLSPARKKTLLSQIHISSSL